MRRRAIALGLLVAAGLVAAPGLPSRALAGDGAAIIVEVNGSPITRADLDEALLMDEDFLRVQRLGNAAAAREMRRQLEERILEALIDELLLSEAARAARITLTPEEEREVARLFEERVKEGWGSVETLEDALKARGVRLERLKARHRSGFIVRKLAFEEAGRGGFVRPEELRRYYEDHKEGYRRSGSVVVSLIRVRKAGRSPADARALIDAAAKRLEAGETFAQVAKDYPDGPQSEDGGALKTKGLDEIRKEWREPLRALAPLVRSQVIETRDDFLIARIDALEPERIRGFEEVQDEIYKTLEDDVRRERLEALRLRSRQAAFIKRRPPAGQGPSPGGGP